MKKYMISGALGGLLAVSMVSCGGTAQKKAEIDKLTMDPSQPLPEGLVNLIDGIEKNEPTIFAANVLYPLERPYPLKDIRDSVEMVRYYNIMVDDSIRTVIGQSGREGWSEVGWRGWTLDAGQYLWYEDGVYSFPYLSQTEGNLLKTEKNKEIRSLAPSLRAGWEPVGCLQSEDPSRDLFRIDYNPQTHLYRLLEYKDLKNLGGDPSAQFTGQMEEEGTARNRIYTFAGESGETIRFEADPSDDSALTLDWLDSQSKPIRQVSVTPTYWLDHILN